MSLTKALPCACVALSVGVFTSCRTEQSEATHESVGSAPPAQQTAPVHTAPIGEPRGRPEPQSQPQPEGSNKKGYVFTKDWFSWNINTWKIVLSRLSGQPNLHYIEVGVWEGRSLLWMLDNILTHPSTRATGVDVVITDNLRSNLAKSGHEARVKMIHGSSQVELRKLPLESADIVYIDGSHTADDVLADAVQSWELLKTGGLLIMDDYEWNGASVADGRPLPDELLPRRAIEAFLEAYKYELKIVHQGWQVVVEKQKSPCGPDNKGYCSPIGEYAYVWRGGRLVSPKKPGTDVAITERERSLVENTLRRTWEPDSKLLGDPMFTSLCERLKGP